MQVEVDHVRAEARGGEFERDARARARLEEQVRHGAAEQRAVAGRQVARFTDVELREVEQVHDLVTREAFEREQVAQAAGMVALQVSAGVSLQGVPIQVSRISRAAFASMSSGRMRRARVPERRSLRNSS